MLIYLYCPAHTIFTPLQKRGSLVIVGTTSLCEGRAGLRPHRPVVGVKKPFFFSLHQSRGV